MKYILPFLCASFCLLHAAPAGAGEVTIYRDGYGVPHIYADTPADGAFAMGYAQAEDRLQDIYDNIRIGIGRMAEAYGPEHVEKDYIMRLLRNADLCKAYYEQAPAEQTVLLDQFVAGVEHYLEEHPEAEVAHPFDLEPWQLLTIWRAMIMRWPLDNVFSDLEEDHSDPGYGSNAWIVANSRTAGDETILLADPHLTWEGMAVFYQAVTHAGELTQDGFFLVGSPIVAIGHNGHVAWASTTGGTDTGDVYMMKLNPNNPMQYEYDGEWRDIEMKMITIPVAGGDDVTRRAAYTHLGPAVAEPDLEKNLLYVGASPYFEDIVVPLEQSYAMVMSRSVEEFYDALKINTLMDQNIPHADRKGDIGYVRIGRAPVRPEGYNFRAPVPGHTSETAWKGYYPLSAHVQIKNPKQGYLQNNNISPANMMVDSPMTPDKYPEEIYNVTWDTDNPRSRRTIQLLDADESVTREEAMAYATDVYDLLAKPWQRALQSALDVAEREHLEPEGVADALHALLEWDGYIVKNSVPTPLYEHLRLLAADKVDVVAIAEGASLSLEDKHTLLELLAESVKAMTEAYGRWDVPWGAVHVVGRGDEYYPTAGADFGANSEGPNFTETLWDVRYKKLEGAEGKYVAINGTMAMMLMFLDEDGIEAYSVMPWGQSGDPDSPHYMDQGRELYQHRKLRPTLFAKDDLMPHVKSETTLTAP